MLNITIIAGARPNFVKIAPIIKAINSGSSTHSGLRQAQSPNNSEGTNNNEGTNITFRLVHTGQHYDKKMSGSFFEQLGIPDPDANLNAGGGTQAEQAANIMIRFEQELLKNPCDVVLVVGDVTSTMACSVTAKKLNIPVVHVEAGIRSWDLTMPEEINRMITDSISDHFFTTSELANENLRKSGITDDRIHFVGNTMIDTLLANMDKLIAPKFDFPLENGKYIVLTLHRPSNVDEGEQLKAMMDAILKGSGDIPILFPVHPRTARSLKDLGISDARLHYVEPLSYLEFNYLVKHSMAVITDSGGITEETTIMGIPCLTLRENTERPETITHGTNELVGTDPKNVLKYLDILLKGNWKKGGEIPMWDGKTSERIVAKLVEIYGC